MIAIIDNYDSFTYNLAQLSGELGAEPRVFRNDRITPDELEAMQPTHVVISPGPGTPDDAGVSGEMIRRFHGRVPILGVCLGHQCIAHVFGGVVGPAPRLMHGKVSQITHSGGALFAGVPSPFQATRYHSLIAHEPLPEQLQVLARTAEGEVMALRHREGPTFGVQFHPESILTPVGRRMLHNFFRMGASLPAGPEASEARTIDLPTAIGRALDKEHLSAEEAEALMGHIMDGEATPTQIGAYLVALRAKGETVSEIVGFARAMRGHVTPVHATREPLLDTCGTGGDGAHTFNISTTAALVVSGAGVAVAKHGNRSVSSRSGSADVLQALGVKLELSPEMLGHCIDEVGIGFLFAPLLHPAMKHAGAPRREIGVRSVFNILGPLTNPAGASRQLIGVYDRRLAEPLAQALGELGSEEACVASSSDGLDELSTSGPNAVALLRGGVVSQMEIDPAEYDFPRGDAAALRGGDATENAAITRDVLSGTAGLRRDAVLLNAGLALVIAGAAEDLRAGIGMAAESIDSGAATRTLAALVDFTQRSA